MASFHSREGLDFDAPKTRGSAKPLGPAVGYLGPSIRGDQVVDLKFGPHRAREMSSNEHKAKPIQRDFVGESPIKTNRGGTL